ncbi:dihydropteroate synthase [Halobacteriales archaeon QS_8_69_73]|nr:MAG: dihydropteroate synthase [Halobacteriales archaeon QS_8_69_73]
MKTVKVGDLSIGDGHESKVMSVLNMSEDSEYESSVHIDAEKAAAVVDEELVPAGADIIDIGLQSANPKYETKSPEYELERLKAAAEVIDNVESDTVFSIETRYAEVAEEAIQKGFHIINDVCGFADPEMRPTCEAYDVPVIKMASPPDLDRPGALKTVDDVFEALERGGVTDRTIVDPAFGGWYDRKTYEDNREMFRRLSEFRAFGCPILTATNREDFLGDLANQPETEDQLAASLAAAALEVDRGAHVIRTHDTRETYDVVQVVHALGRERISRTNPVNVTELSGVTRREMRRHFSVSDRTVNHPARASSLTFSVENLPDGATDTAEKIARLNDLPAAISDGTLVLSGTPQTFVDFLDDLPTDDPELASVADSIGASLERK